MNKKDFDFGGWATRNDLRCIDGRTIRRDAFKEQDGATVPIVWSHIHDDPEMVLGHAALENRPEGVYAWLKFNDLPKGQATKRLIEQGNVTGLSIWANELKQKAGDVLHGVIREVSVVLAGANPGAFIDNVIMAHSADEASLEEAIITTGEPIELFHSAIGDKKDPEEDEEKEEPVQEEKPEEVKKPVEEKKEEKGETPVADAKEKEVTESKKNEDDETIEDVFNTLTEKQKKAVYAIVGEALKDAGVDEDDDEETEEEEKEMKHNVFDAQPAVEDSYISHDAMKEVLADAKRLGSLKEAVEKHSEEGGVLAHALQNADGSNQLYGMTDVDYLFPDTRAIDNVPQFIKRNDEWVNVVINGTHHTPFSRIKSVFANITNDEARARGYVKNKKKADEVFSLLKRSTDPQTIYKKQKMDRDDIIDITDFDVVAWLRGEMRMMLNEEIARAVLIGDGRLSSDDDKIKEDHIRPIVTDASLYNITAQVPAGETTEITAKNIIKAAIRARKDYKGSGSPVMFVSETLLTEMMLLEDGLGHPLYVDEAALARRLRVSRIIPCPVIDGHKVDGKDLYGVIVNLTDYNIGADKGGEINMFDDFDIDFNQQKYLIETRISGALVRPYSAITLVAGAAASDSTDGDDDDTNNG